MLDELFDLSLYQGFEQVTKDEATMAGGLAPVGGLTVVPTSTWH